MLCYTFSKAIPTSALVLHQKFIAQTDSQSFKSIKAQNILKTQNIFLEWNPINER